MGQKWQHITDLAHNLAHTIQAADPRIRQVTPIVEPSEFQSQVQFTSFLYSDKWRKLARIEYYATFELLSIPGFDLAEYMVNQILGAFEWLEANPEARGWQ
jgi:hypothetical protein